SEIALPVRRRLRAFVDEQAEAGALGVIFRGQWPGRTIRQGAAARHRRHGQPVWQAHAADRDGLPDRGLFGLRGHECTPGLELNRVPDACEWRQPGWRTLWLFHFVSIRPIIWTNRFIIRTPM